MYGIVDWFLMGHSSAGKNVYKYRAKFTYTGEYIVLKNEVNVRNEVSLTDEHIMDNPGDRVPAESFVVVMDGYGRLESEPLKVEGL